MSLYDNIGPYRVSTLWRLGGGYVTSVSMAGLHGTWEKHADTREEAERNHAAAREVARNGCRVMAASLISDFAKPAD